MPKWCDGRKRVYLNRNVWRRPVNSATEGEENGAADIRKDSAPYSYSIVRACWNIGTWAEAHPVACHSVIESVDSNRHAQYRYNRVFWSDRTRFVMASQLSKVIREPLQSTAVYKHFVREEAEHLYKGRTDI